MRSTRSGNSEVKIGRVLRLDHHAALHLLRDLARDRGVLVELRRLWAREVATVSLSLVSDEQVLTGLARQVASGHLVLARVPPLTVGGQPAGTGTAGSEVDPGAAPAPAPAPPPAEQGQEQADEANAADEMLASVDAAAQAATLEAAARDGAPFCEECEKKKKNAEREKRAA